MKERGERQLIEASDVGVIDLSEATVESPESVPEDEVEPVADIECGKLEGKLKEKFIGLYRLLAPLGDTADHSPTSKRIHFKVGKKGYALLVYHAKRPTLWLNYMDEGAKKRRLEKYSITESGVVDADGNSLTHKQIVKVVRSFKKKKGI